MKHLFSRYLSIVVIFILGFSFKIQAQTGPTNDSLYIVGSATPGGWSNPIPAANVASQTFTVVSPTEYKINVLLIGGSEYKFISQNGSWGNNWGIAKADDPTEVNGGPFTFNSQNIKAPSATGIYTIDVNFAINIFTIKLASTPKVVISSFAPTTAATGDSVTIKGSDFTGATAVNFGGNSAASFKVINDSTITAVVGNGASGTVQVTAPDGVGILAGFTYNTNMLFLVGSATLGGWTNPIPTADSLVQQFTRISSTEYSITATLTGGKEYKFIPQDGSWTLSYGISVTDDPAEVNGGPFITNGNNILAPSASGSYIIDVNFATNMFTVTPAVVSSVSVYSFSPTSADSGTTVTIKGIGFTGATAVGFGGTAATSFSVVNDSTITAVVSGGASGSVQVVAPNGTGSLDGFTFISSTPIATTLYIVGSATPGGWSNPITSADSVAQSFTQISKNEFLISTHLSSGGEYKFIPTDGSWTQSYGIATADDSKEVSGGALVANGQNILAPTLSGTYSIDVNLNTNTFTTTLVSPDTLFIVGSATVGGWNNPIPSIDSAKQQFTQFSPTEYTITLPLIGGNEYKFLAQDNGNWTINWGIGVADDTTMVNGGSLVYGTNSQNILAPKQNGVYTIDVDFAANKFYVTLDSVATINIASFSPATADSGTVVTIKGSGFTGATSVSFGGTAVDSFTVWNDSTITAIVGNGSTGAVQVISPNGTGIAQGFTYFTATGNTGFIVGSATAGGWANPIPTADSVAQMFKEVAPNQLSITLHLNGGGEYKFIPTDGSWATSYGISIGDDPTQVNGGTLQLNGQNILAPSLSGIYTINVNVKTLTFTTTLVSPDTLFIVGNATANGWNNPLQSADSAAQQFTQVSPTEFQLSVYLVADSSYKFLARDNGDWTYNWGVAIANDSTSVNGGTLVSGVTSNDILAPSVSGTYVIDVNFATNSFKVSNPLPVKIASFTAAVSNNTIKTSWQTASEAGMAHFTVQHSTDGSNFASIGTVKAVGNGANSYQFTDAQPANGINYYRLESVDKNGAVSYSKVATVQFAGSSNKFALYPTLVRDGVVNIRFNEASAGKATIRVIDLNGRVLQSDVVSISAGSNVISHKITASSKGTYIVSVETASGKQAFKLIVE